MNSEKLCKSDSKSGWSFYQWSIVILLLLGLILSAIDRVNISVTISYWIKNKLMTPTEAGLIQSLFGWSIIVSLLFAGPLLDRFHPRRILPISVILWSIATCLSGITTKLPILASARALLGIGESGLLPSAPKLIVENIHDKDRSKAISLYFAGNKIGPTIGIPLSAFLLVGYGWHMVFYITGALGILWVLLWFMIYRKDKGIIDTKEDAYENQAKKVKWSELFAYRNTWAIILGQFGYLYVFYVFVTWLPGFLVLQHHISIGKSGSLGSLPFIVAIVTTLLGGWIADKWIMKSQNKTLVRKSIIGSGMILSTVFIIIAAYSQAVTPAVIFLTLSMGAMGLVTGSVNALPMDLAPKEMVSSLSSLQNFGGNMGAAVAPLVTGILFNQTHSFEIPLIVTGVIALVFGAGSYLFILQKVEKSYGIGSQELVNQRSSTDVNVGRT